MDCDGKLRIWQEVYNFECGVKVNNNVTAVLVFCANDSFITCRELDALNNLGETRGARL